jgi:hypothetical protein
LHPNPDGSLAIWLADGDYALLGSIERLTEGAAPYEVVALFRVPAGAVAAYVGELTMTTATHEGWYAAHGELGEASLTLLPLPIARLTLEQRLGTLPHTPVVSPWCVGEDVPGFNDSKLATHGRQLLDRGCAHTVAGTGPPAAAQADTSDPARIAIYGIGDTVVGHLTLGLSTTADARRLFDRRSGLGPARANQITFRIGPATLQPRVLYNPPWTMHQLYFQDDTLVLVVDGMPRRLPETGLEFSRRFPMARETHREAGWYELQTPLSECVWLVAVFSLPSDAIEPRCSGTRPLDSGWAPDRHHEQRRQEMIEQPLRGAADQQAIDPTLAMRSDHDQVGMPDRSFLRDRVVRYAPPHNAVVQWEIG